MSLFNSCRLFLKLILFLILIGLSENSYSVTVLGTGTSALVGDDLTDPENDGVDGSNLNWNWSSISASSENYWHAEGAYNVFDNKVGASNDKWCCNGPTQWIQVGFSQAYVLDSFTITSGNDVPSRDPDVWKIQGSNDGSNWTDIYVYNNNGTSPWGSTRLQVRLYEGGGVDYNTPSAYSYFRYYVSSIVSGSMHQINEIEFFGTAADTTAPTLSSSTPADNATNVAVDANIVLNFDENVDVESGNIIIKRSSDDSIFETIAVTSDRVRGTGTSKIIIDPIKNFKVNTSYYLIIAATAFDDTAGNSYAGISSKTALNFITKKGRIFNKTVKTLIKNQSAAAINSMSQSINRVNSRMNFIRPMQNNSFNQNIELAMNLNDPFADRIFDALAIKYLKPKKETKKWAAWSEGNLSFGRIGHRGENLGQDIHSDGLTFGIDKKISAARTFGMAVSQSWQKTQVGSNEANMDASSTSILGYGSIKLKERTYIEAAIGLGEMEVNLARSVEGGQNKGTRDGKQIYGSFTYLFEPSMEYIIEGVNTNYYSRLDLGYTMLDDYTENGDDDSVFYDDQNVKSATLSLGYNYSKSVEIESGIITQLLKFEFGKSTTVNSLSEAYYINDASTIYANAIADQDTYHGQVTLGFSMNLKNDVDLNLSLDHYRNDKDTFLNSLTINLRKLF